MNFDAITTAEPESLEAYRARKARQDAEAIEQIKSQNAERWLARLREESGLGERFLSRTFASWRTTARNVVALNAAQRAAKSGDGLWIHGPVGTGKTHLAAAIVSDCLSRSVAAVFVTGIRLLDRIRSSYNRDGGTRDGERDIVATYAVVPVLALDDLGKERFTAWTAERMYDLINRRYEANSGVVVTSNLSPESLARQWQARDMDPTIGVALVRRLSEMVSEIVEVEA